jgi:Arc/MetJ family transcription regulator
MKRTNIVINEKLIEEGKKATGLRTSRALIDLALTELIRHNNQRRLLRYNGKIDWSGDLQKMRSMRGNSLSTA